MTRAQMSWIYPITLILALAWMIFSYFDGHQAHEARMSGYADSFMESAERMEAAVDEYEKLEQSIIEHFNRAFPPDQETASDS